MKLWRFVIGDEIFQVLELTVTEAKELFLKHPAVINKLETLDAVGLVFKIGTSGQHFIGRGSSAAKTIS